MKNPILIGLLIFSASFACKSENDERYIFFLHNRFLETHDLNDSHPEYGRTDYLEIISEFEKNGFNLDYSPRNLAVGKASRKWRRKRTLVR